MFSLFLCVDTKAQPPSPVPGFGGPGSAPRTLVMPFENLKRDGKIFWLGEASAVVLTDDLNAFGANAITRQERRRAFERLQVPPVAALTDATVIRIGQLVGAAQVIVGSLQMEGDELAVRARSIALDTGRMQVDVTERGPLTGLFAVFDRIARRLAPLPTPGTAPPAAPHHPPVGVFEDYIKGLLAQMPATAINYLNAAVRAQPSFDRARLALWDAYVDQGDHEQALAAVQPVAPDSPYAQRARFLAGVSQLALQKFDEAFDTFKALADAQPTAPALNNLGIVQLRRVAAAPSGGAPPKLQSEVGPSYFFNRAREADPVDPDYLFNLGYAYWENRDPQAAIYWLREAVRRTPADGDAHFVLAAALAMAGNHAEAARERELARRLSSTYDAMTVPKGLERVKNEFELPHVPLEKALSTNEQRSQEELAKFYLDRGRRLFTQENDRDAVTELNHALYLSPYLAEGHLLLGRVHLRNGRLHEAIDAFKIALWSAESAEAHAALGEAYRQAKDPAAARVEADRALALDPASADARQLIARLDGR